MANHQIYETKNFSEVLRKLVTTDPAHADTFNPLFERLINNDSYLKAFIEGILSVNGHTHSGIDGDGPKIPLANIELPSSMGRIVTEDILNAHINERNPHGTRASDIGAETPSGVQAKIDAAIAAHSADTTKHVTQAERDAWNSASQKIGDLTTLNTTAKTNLVDAVNELFTNVSNGKIQVRDAITGKGGIVADSDGDGVPTFEELVTGVNGILTGASIKSVQSGVVAIGLGSYADVTISNVDMSKSFVIVEAIQATPYDDPALGTVTGKLINNTTLRVMRKRNMPDTSAYTTVCYQVVELENIKSIQVVQVVLMSTGTTNINITPVNLNKTFLVGSYMSAVSGSVSTGRGYHWYAFFNSPSQISVRNTAGQGEAILYVVEFN
ncbi:hypothetical protein [Anoxybacillus ayderensis]|uniref:hypothetical protein n=1 Tax=Anoxybacillus ayderensis TaxID=265546 RepID=UPI002E2366DA|nr:hypothetical protein [Anoxybacillus ayderensis]